MGKSTPPPARPDRTKTIGCPTHFVRRGGRRGDATIFPASHPPFTRQSAFNRSQTCLILLIAGFPSEKFTTQ